MTMEGQLLVRTYKVGCGDCIFIRIPDKGRLFHLLIDCGNFFGEKSAELKQALKNIEELLNDEKLVPRKQRGHLDLLVATHQHWDHMKGFEILSKSFKKIKIDRIWLSVGMKKDHPKGKQLRALQNRVEETIQRFSRDSDFRLSPGLLSLLSMMSLSGKDATEALTDNIPSKNGIEPFYVYRGFEEDLSAAKEKEAKLDFKETTTKLSVLAPEKEIDKSYVSFASGFLGKLDDAEKSIQKLIPKKERIGVPKNISMRQFRELKISLRDASLIAALQSNHIVNNTSVVLLLEWRGRRLLFTGDAEEDSWDLMWKNAHSEINKPVDFLKVSHHGSRNGTPFDPDQTDNDILDSILPIKNANVAKAVVSTKVDVIQAEDNPVPFPKLLKELAKRVCNTEEYPVEHGKQPQRTDEIEANWIDVTLKPKN